LPGIVSPETLYPAILEMPGYSLSPSITTWTDDHRLFEEGLGESLLGTLVVVSQVLASWEVQALLLIVWRMGQRLLFFYGACPSPSLASLIILIV
jgi:hypothetical protein